MKPLHLSACPDLGALLDGLPVGTALLDGQGRVLMLNKALEALTGFTSQEAWGLPRRHVLRSRVCVQSGPDGQETTDCINRHRRKIPVRLTPVPVRDEGGDFLCTLLVVEDLSDLREMEARLSQAVGQGQIVGRGPAMEKILHLTPIIAQYDSPVLITGDTGTGKDLVAESIHKASPRFREPFVRFSCGPMPAQLLDTELFGRMGGEPVELKPGRFQQAQGGSLYLSEIADLPLEQQASLVRYLDEGMVLPVGAAKTVRVQVRLMASTAQSPEKLVADGRLREDLFHRLAAIRLHLPRLKERGEDLDFLLRHFLEHYAGRFKKSIATISPKAQRILSEHDFPGNVRELKNIMEFAVMVCPGDTIRTEHLPGHLPGVTAQVRPRAGKSGRKEP